MAALSVALGASLAFAGDGSATMGPYQETTYTVSVFSGNQGTLSYIDAAGRKLTGQTQVTISPVPAQSLFMFEDFTVEVPDESKYYVKGIREAALDNVRSDKNREGKTHKGAETVYYARPDADGVFVTQGETMVNGEPVVGVAIDEDRDFVVAYGIKANRVSYTVTYVDAVTGESLREPETFFGDVGDMPATAPRYVEGYVPQATLILISLGPDEGRNTVAYRYTRLSEGSTTELNSDGTVSVRVPTANGSNGESGAEGEGTVGDGANADEARAVQRASVVPVAYTTVVEPGLADGFLDGQTADEEPEVLRTIDGQAVISDEGVPLAAPGVEVIEDNETALASGMEIATDAPEPSTDRIPWGTMAVAFAAAIAVVLAMAHRKQAAAKQS